MSMMCFVRSQCPRKLDPPEQCQIKGLNVEAVVEIPIPPSSWLASPEYWDLSLRTNDDDSNCAFFSLNLSMYPPTFDVFEWDDKWFFLYGLVHPYALTWEVKPDDGVDTNNDPQDYTIPALMVRDHGYQPWVHRILICRTRLLPLTNAAASTLECSTGNIPSPSFHRWSASLDSSSALVVHSSARTPYQAWEKSKESVADSYSSQPSLPPEIQPRLPSRATILFKSSSSSPSMCYRGQPAARE